MTTNWNTIIENKSMKSMKEIYNELLNRGIKDIMFDEYTLELSRKGIGDVKFDEEAKSISLRSIGIVYHKMNRIDKIRIYLTFRSFFNYKTKNTLELNHALFERWHKIVILLMEILDSNYAISAEDADLYTSGFRPDLLYGIYHKNIDTITLLILDNLKQFYTNKKYSLNDIKKFIEKATTEHIKFGDIHYRSFILIDNKSKTPKKLFNNLMKVMKIDPGKRKGW